MVILKVGNTKHLLTQGSNLTCQQGIESGSILEKNIRIEKDLTLLEKDPFFDGWLYRVLPEDIAHQLKYLIPGGAEEI